jgi:superfamily II DNA or RNA helicase
MTTLPKIIDNRRKKLIDCLVEASRDHDELSIATGYWDLKGTKLLLPYIKKYKKIRILIGRELLIPRHQLNEIEADYPDRDIFEDLQHLKPDSELRPTIVEIKSLIESGVLEVKVFKKTFLHAKCYIFGGFNSKSAVGVIGSSNFTENGLTSNFELNAGESDHRIVQFHPTHEGHENGHLSWFEEAWNDEGCIEWTGQFEELIDTSIHGEKLFSPYEMYIKTLDYMYGDLLKNDREITHLSSKKLQDFQERSVKQIMWRLEKNGVAMLADSVGLGKTITAIGVIKQYSGKRVVVIAPKSLVGQWNTEIARERLLGITVISLQNRNEIEDEQKKDKYLPVSLFVIDESHNLRSQNSKRFDQVKEWVINNENADTLLLTATPVNNSIDDLTNQILIGTRGEQDLLKVNVRNSEGVVKSRSFFDALAEIKKKISQNRAQGNDMKPIYEEARQIIDPILREFVIRNTRQSIEKELEGKGLDIDGKSYKFPKIKVSNVDFFSGDYKSIKLDNSIEAIENCSVDFIQGTTDKLEHPLRQLREWKNQELDKSDKSAIYRLYQYILSLSFVPYRTAMYDHRVYGKTLDELKTIKFKDDSTKSLKLQLSMYGLLRIVLMKRFESSAFALLTSAKKYQKRLKAFEEIFNKKKILLNLSEIDNLFDEFNEDSDDLDLSDEDLIKRAEETGIPVSNKSHDIQAITDDIASERKILDSIVEMAELFNQDDKKLESFNKLISDISKQDPNRKVLIFSFFGDTVTYLKDKLQDKSVFTSSNSSFVSGKDRMNALNSADRFAPVARDSQEEVAKDGELTYLVSTDVLAEGQNLQDCGLLINYDLHWNPVRMIQRNGRINRLGSPHSEIEVKNIIPHKELEQFLGLVSKLQDKISLIQATIGSDSSVLGEEINPIDYKGIYDQDSNLATQEYLRLEQEADVFTDDQYISDLKDYYENVGQEALISINKIPMEKWGIIDPQKVTLNSKIPEAIIFTRIEFTNGKDQFTFYKNNSQGTAIGVLLTGEALQILRTNYKNRSLDKISLKKYEQFDSVIKNGPQITRYERDTERLTPSQVSLMEEARIADWTAEDRQRLESLLTTRNVFQSRLARKLTKEIREVIKDGKFSKVADVLNKIKNILPPETKEQVKAKSLTPIFGYARDNK